jgi:hypothetical protein
MPIVMNAMWWNAGADFSRLRFHIPGNRSRPGARHAMLVDIPVT